MPTILIFPGKRILELLMKGVTSGAIGWCQPSGWIQANIFTDEGSPYHIIPLQGCSNGDWEKRNNIWEVILRNLKMKRKNQAATVC